MGGWLLDAAKGKSTGEPPAGLRADLSERIGALQLRAQVAKEIVANLQHVEQVLDGFARDAAKRDTLPGLAPHLRQIHGALMVLRFEGAARALAICERHDRRSAPSPTTPARPRTWTGSRRASRASASSSTPACRAASRRSRRSSCSSGATTRRTRR